MEQGNREWRSRIAALARQGARELLTTVLPALLVTLLVVHWPPDQTKLVP
jgi:hypothetical protein